MYKLAQNQRSSRLARVVRAIILREVVRTRVPPESGLTEMVTLLRSMSCCYQEALVRFYLYDQPQERICNEMHLSDERFLWLKAGVKKSFCKLAGNHSSDDRIERFSMGKLRSTELADFEIHLLQCDECQVAVSQMDLFLIAIRGAGELMARQKSELPVSVLQPD